MFLRAMGNPWREQPGTDCPAFKDDVLAGEVFWRKQTNEDELLQQLAAIGGLDGVTAILALVREAKRMTELLLESQEMQSVYQPGSNKPEPANPERMAAINAELKEVSSRFQQLVQDATAKQKH